MNSVGDVKPGDAVQIVAADNFFAFIDGWKGRHCGYLPEGYAIVKCSREDGEKTFFVPDAQLVRIQ